MFGFGETEKEFISKLVFGEVVLVEEYFEEWVLCDGRQCGYFLCWLGLQLGKLFHFIIYNKTYFFHPKEKVEIYDDIADIADRCS